VLGGVQKAASSGGKKGRCSIAGKGKKKKRSDWGGRGRNRHQLANQRGQQPCVYQIEGRSHRSLRKKRPPCFHARRKKETSSSSGESARPHFDREAKKMPGESSKKGRRSPWGMDFEQSGNLFHALSERGEKGRGLNTGEKVVLTK